MPLTTVSNGRTYDWSHAVGRGAATGTGFNYPQTMCLGNDGDVFVANRGNENNFGQRVNRVKLGAPGEEELLSEFFQHGEGEGQSTWPFGVRSMVPTPSMFQMNGPIRSLSSTAMARSCAHGEKRAVAMVSCCGRLAWYVRRTETSSSWIVGTIGSRSLRLTGSSWPSMGRREAVTVNSTSLGE